MSSGPLSRCLAIPLLLALAGGCGGDDDAAAIEEDVLTSSYDIGPFAIPSGEDVTMCTYLRASNLEAEDITEFGLDFSGHHLMIYTVDHAIEKPPSVCSQGGQPGWRLVLATQGGSAPQAFPEGVGFQIKPRQQFVIETHYINTGASDIAPRATFSTKYAPRGSVTSHAAIFSFGTFNIDIPPNAAWSNTVECTLPSQVTLRSMAAHQHRRGTGLSVDLAPSGQSEAARLYETTEWEAPPRIDFEGGQELGAGDKITVTCDWTNDTPNQLRYPNEMCFAAGYYWPAEGGLSCVSGGGKDDCQCYFNDVSLDPGPGGAQVDVSLTRAETIQGAGGEIDEGAPIFCTLWRAEDWTGLLPKEGTQPYYTRDAIGVPLTTTTTEAHFMFEDVTPGDFVVSCMMDTIGGGPLPGKGNVVNAITGKVSASEGKPGEVSVVLNVAIP